MIAAVTAINATRILTVMSTNRIGAVVAPTLLAFITVRVKKHILGMDAGAQVI